MYYVGREDAERRVCIFACVSDYTIPNNRKHVAATAWSLQWIMLERDCKSHMFSAVRDRVIRFLLEGSPQMGIPVHTWHLTKIELEYFWHVITSLLLLCVRRCTIYFSFRSFHDHHNNVWIMQFIENCVVQNGETNLPRSSPSHRHYHYRAVLKVKRDREGYQCQCMLNSLFSPTRAAEIAIFSTFFYCISPRWLAEARDSSRLISITSST